MGTLLADLRLGVRMLWKSKGISLVALLSLAVGIGANAAILSLVNAVLFRPHPVAAPHELVVLYTGERSHPYEGTSYPSYLDLRERNGVLSGLAGFGLEQLKLGGPDGAEPVWAEVVSENFFDVLGVRPQLGRGFLEAEGTVPGRDPVVVISHALWTRRFASDPSVVGSTITVNRHALTVVGVAPERFTGMMRGMSIELWVPSMMVPLLDPASGELKLNSRGSRWVTMVGRLRPEFDLTAARERFALLTAEQQAAHPEEWMSRGEQGSTRELAITVEPERAVRVHPLMRPIVLGLAALLFVLVDLVLLIACVNIASVLLARAMARRGEMAVRLALGASRARIVRQLITESLLVALLAGAGGVLLAQWGLDALVASLPSLPEGVRVAVDLRLDGRVVLATLAFATATGVLLGLAPALHGARTPVATLLQGNSQAVTGKHQRSRLRAALIIGQVAVAQLLLIGATLVWRGLDNVRPTSLGFESEEILVASVVLDETGYDERTSQLFFERLGERVAALPGVRSASLVDAMPGGALGRSRRGVGIVGGSADRVEIDASIVGPHYYTSMNVPFVAGRDFTERDRAGAPCVAIVNEVFARRFLGDVTRALGRALFTRSSEATGCEIVGVIRDDAWQSLVSEVRPLFSLALLQSDERRVTLLAEAGSDPAALAPAVRDVIRELDPQVPVGSVQTLADHFHTMLFPFRMLGLVIGACGVLALVLATIGIYGIVSYSVAQRSREIGIRLALGAMDGRILRLIVGQVMSLVGVGLGAGVLLSAGLARVLSSDLVEGGVLFGVGALDPITFVGVTALLAAIGLFASLIPAWRAVRMDPMRSLRSS